MAAILPCVICGTETAKRPHYRTLTTTVITHKGTLPPDTTVRLCDGCLSSLDTLASREYYHKKYGDFLPEQETAARSGCPLCTIMCHECPYNKED